MGSGLVHAVTADSGTIAAYYFDAWKARDWAALRSLLADDVTFRGPLGSADDAEECMPGLRGIGSLGG